MNLKSLAIVTSWLCFLSLSCLARGEEGKIIAVFGTAASSKTPPPGWKFQWNANGKMGDSSGYAPLSYDEKTMSYGVPDEGGLLQKEAPSSARYLDTYAVKDKDGVPRFYIASYTLAEDATGEVWINNGNILNKPFAEAYPVEIYVNDEMKSRIFIKKDRFAALFQNKLGRLKKGDTIHVAVGPGEKSGKGGGKLHFTIEEYPEGVTPEPPIPILTIPLDGAAPQRNADGKISPDYAQKHSGQVAEMIAKKPELVMLGDSITARWPQEILEEKFGKYRPMKLGVGGDNVQNVIWRVQNGAFDKSPPKMVVLLIGTNNVTHGHTPEEIAAGVVRLIKEIQQRAPECKVLIQGILPRGGTIKEPRNEIVQATNVKLAQLADGKRIFYLDIGDKLVEPDGTITSEIMPDKLHVAGPGYVRWIDALYPTLNKLLTE